MNKECAVLGVCFHNQKYFKTLYRYQNIFTDDQNSTVFKKMCELYENNKSIDFITLTDELKGIVGADYISEIYSYDIYESYFHFYLQDLDENRKIKELCLVGKKIDCKQVTFEEAKKEVKEIIQDNIIYESEILDVRKTIYEYMENINIKNEYYNSNIKWIDENLGGWEKEPRMIIIGARPSKGKTTFWNNIALHLVMKDIPVGFFSAEMQRSDVVTSCLSNLSRVNSMRMRKKDLTKVEMDRIISEGDRLYEKPYFIDDTPNIDISDLEEKFEIMVKKHNIKFCGIDYLQLLQCNLYKKYSRREQMIYLSNTIKKLARTYNVTIFALSQLNREAEEKRPNKSNLLESGQIEQDADMILLLWDKGKVNINDNEFEHHYTIIVDKNKFGADGEFDMRYLKDINRFKDIF